MGVLSHSGSRVICFCFPFGPTSAVFNWYASEGFRGGSLPETNSSKAGPVLSLSLKVVVRMAGRVVGTSSTAVAKCLRFLGCDCWACGRKTVNGDDHCVPCRQR